MVVGEIGEWFYIGGVFIDYVLLGIVVVKLVCLFFD